MLDTSQPELSIVIPVVERHDDLRQLFSEYSKQVEKMSIPAEFIFVIDDRQAEAIPVLRELGDQTTHDVTLMYLGGNFGESSALAVGLERARGKIVATVGAYFQVDPAGLPQAVRLLEDGADLVVARRHPRVDSWINRLQNAAFHWFVNLMAPRPFHDVSCGFRVMKRTVADELDFYGGLHRFIPILALNAGFQVEELSLPQRHEDTPARYYGVSLYLKRVLDVLTLFFLIKFTRRPLRLFGMIGLALSALGMGITGYLGVYRLLQLGAIAGRPLLLLGVLLIVLGIQTLSLGLIGEIIIFTHARKIRDYRISKIVRSPSQPEDQVQPIAKRSSAV